VCRRALNLFEVSELIDGKPSSTTHEKRRLRAHSDARYYQQIPLPLRQRQPRPLGRDSSTRSSASETLVPTDLLRTSRFIAHPWHWSCTAQTPKRPHGTPCGLGLRRLAAKGKTSPRALDGDSAHLSFPFPSSRSYSDPDGLWGSGHPLRRWLSQEVALQQPRVTLQLPSGGDVSSYCQRRRRRACRGFLRY
jgi:hypothetical protein